MTWGAMLTEANKDAVHTKDKLLSLQIKVLLRR